MVLWLSKRQIILNCSEAILRKCYCTDTVLLRAYHVRKSERQKISENPNVSQRQRVP
jgi:hypothetical protein